VWGGLGGGLPPVAFLTACLAGLGGGLALVLLFLRLTRLGVEAWWWGLWCAVEV
jgi:hypothetical protein